MYSIKTINQIEQDGACEGVLSVDGQDVRFRSPVLPFSASPAATYAAPPGVHLVDDVDPLWRDDRAKRPTLDPNWVSTVVKLLTPNAREVAKQVVRAAQQRVATKVAGKELVLAVVRTKNLNLENGFALFDNIHELLCARCEEAFRLYVRHGRAAFKFLRSLDSMADEKAMLLVKSVLQSATPELGVFTANEATLALVDDAELVDAWRMALAGAEHEPLSSLRLRLAVSERVVGFFAEHALLVNYTIHGHEYYRPHIYKDSWALDDALVEEVAHDPRPEMLRCARHGDDDACMFCYGKKKPTPGKKRRIVTNAHCVIENFTDFVATTFLWAVQARLSEADVAAAAPAKRVDVSRSDDAGWAARLRAGPKTHAGWRVFPYPVAASYHDACDAPLRDGTWAVADGKVIFVKSMRPFAFVPARMYPFDERAGACYAASVPENTRAMLGLPSELLGLSFDADAYDEVHFACARDGEELDAITLARVRRVVRDGGRVVVHTSKS